MNGELSEKDARLLDLVLSKQPPISEYVETKLGDPPKLIAIGYGYKMIGESEGLKDADNLV